eukprot:GFUD01103283.1.p1 GENE.GFUD01103283.1~~GFUD01103283.1.p1  ORF type:complete len:104 (-),score=21.15 GFUD01103283.1:3-314(-)
MIGQEFSSSEFSFVKKGMVGVIVEMAAKGKTKFDLLLAYRCGDIEKCPGPRGQTSKSRQNQPEGEPEEVRRVTRQTRRAGQQCDAQVQGGRHQVQREDRKSTL